MATGRKRSIANKLLHWNVSFQSQSEWHCSVVEYFRLWDKADKSYLKYHICMDDNNCIVLHSIWPTSILLILCPYCQICSIWRYNTMSHFIETHHPHKWQSREQQLTNGTMKHSNEMPSSLNLMAQTKFCLFSHIKISYLLWRLFSILSQAYVSRYISGTFGTMRR